MKSDIKQITYSKLISQILLKMLMHWFESRTAKQMYSAKFIIICFLDYTIFIKFYLKPRVPTERLSRTTVWVPLI